MPNVTTDECFTPVLNDNGLSQSNRKKQQHIATATKPDEFFSSMKKDALAAMELFDNLNTDIVNKFVEIIYDCQGILHTSGIGKSGTVADRFSASLSSTGTPAFYVHGAEWTHGNLGKARRGDVCIFFSHSGNTKECVLSARHLKHLGVTILSIVGKEGSQLAQISDATLCYNIGRDLEEPIGGVPTTSVILQEMLVNGIVCELIRRKRFTKIEFARNHPGGSLGKLLCDNNKSESK